MLKMLLFGVVTLLLWGFCTRCLECFCLICNKFVSNLYQIWTCFVSYDCNIMATFFFVLILAGTSIDSIRLSAVKPARNRYAKTKMQDQLQGNINHGAFFFLWYHVIHGCKTWHDMVKCLWPLIFEWKWGYLLISLR